MPIYEYRCADCDRISERATAVVDRPVAVKCDHCGGEAHRIVSRAAVRLSSSSKAARLDPKYDKMVDRAMANTPLADPDRLLKKMRPFSDAKD